MSKILITGNGFDLFYHLPTKYNHFMAVMKTIEENHFNDKIPFDELFGKIFKEKHLSDYNSITENYNTKKIEFETNHVIEIKELLTKNKWYKHFKTVNELNTWIDFETEIENVLLDLTKIFSFIKENPKQEFNFYNNRVIKSNRDFKNFGFVNTIDGNHVFIKKEYLDFKKFEFNESLLLSELLVSLEMFINIFNSYLKNLMNIFFKHVNERKTFFHKIDKVYTFNYTSTFENLHNYPKEKITYLHGNVDLNNIVLGISDIPISIKYSKFFGFTKYYQKTRKNTNHKFIDLPKEKNNLGETVFYIFGHSLDKSDEEYVLEVFKFLKLDNNKYSKICVFYFSENDYNNKLNNLFNIVEKETIVEMHKTKRLYFVELTEENLLNEFNRSLLTSKQIIGIR